MTDVRDLGAVAARYWWLLLVRGILLIVLGIMMLAWPQATVLVFAVLFAAYLLVDGVLEIVQGFEDRQAGQPSAGNFTIGILAIVFGIVVLVWPHGVGPPSSSSSPSGPSWRPLPGSWPASGCVRCRVRAGAGSWPGASWPGSSGSP